MDKKDELIAAALRWADFEQAMFDAVDVDNIAFLHAMADSAQADRDLRRAVEDYKSRIEVSEKENDE
jgi:hypothetical protein